jgi:hypothetical protein
VSDVRLLNVGLPLLPGAMHVIELRTPSSKIEVGKDFPTFLSVDLVRYSRKTPLDHMPVVKSYRAKPSNGVM